MKKVSSLFAALFVMVLLLTGCSQKPSDSEIEKLLFGNNDDKVFKYDNFTKLDGFQKDDKTYIADVKYNMIFRIGKKELDAEIKKEGNVLASIAIDLTMRSQFGDYDKGATYVVTKKVTLIKKESGWNIEKIDDNGIQRMVTKEEEKAVAEKKTQEATEKQTQEEAWAKDPAHIKAANSQEYLSKLLDVKGSSDTLKAEFESRFKQKTKLLGVNPDSYASDVTFIENLISACGHSQCVETHGVKKVSNENKPALIYNIVDTGKTNSGLIMGVKFELSSEDQFKPERDDISKNAQRMAKYSIITCFFDGASALR